MDNAKRIVTVGTFDGLHRGHKLVLQTLFKEAERRGLKPTVITFDRHPLESVAPERAPKMLLAIDRRDELLKLAGFDVERLEFNKDVQCLSAKEWLGRLARDYDAAAIVIGYDNTFGSDGVNLTLADFRRLGSEIGLEIIEAPSIPGCSSSVARKAIASGDTISAQNILGTQFRLIGHVVHGRGVGRTIGVPTINIRTDARQLLPREGVYDAEVKTPLGKYVAVVNVGRAPTLTDGSNTAVEAHLLDFNDDLYGNPVEIIFGPRLRDEQKFPSVDDLKLRIAADIEAVRKLHENQL